VGAGDGTIERSHAEVRVTVGGAAKAGGLVGSSSFNIAYSFATGSVSGGDDSFVGGLVGTGGNISQSYATGKVIGGENSDVGGLAGADEGSLVTNSYTTGAVQAGTTSNLGGFVGEIAGVKLQSSYAIGHVKGGTAATSGGFMGVSRGSDDLGTDYWDTQTSGKSRREGYGDCRDPHCDRSIKGVKTEAFQAGLPPGFDPAIWGEKAGINGGFPYLLTLPPK